MTSGFDIAHATAPFPPTPEREAWLAAVPALAEELADDWGLRPDGVGRLGTLSVVWPVLGATDRRLALKVHEPFAGTDGERLALEVAAGDGVVELVAADPSRHALLLRRLDAARSLEQVEIGAATEVLADLILRFTSHPAPPGLRTIEGEADRVRASIRSMLDRTPRILPTAVAERAAETLQYLAERVRADPGPLALLHGDLHYENVLHTLPDEPPAWVAIDPLPFAGYPELEVVAVMRNRWDAAVATGDADRSLRRRFDLLVDRCGLDRDLALLVLHAYAVESVLWLSEGVALSALSQSFLRAFSVITAWSR